MNQAPEDKRRLGGPEILALSLIVILAFFTVLGAVTVFQLPHAITEQGKDIVILYEVVLGVSFVVFWGVTSGIIWAMLHYRRRTPDEVPEQIHGSSTLEAAWTIIPVLILVALVIPSIFMLIDLKTPPKAADIDVTVEAIGHQWWWEFDYTDAGIKVQSTPPNYDALEPPHLVVPVGATIRVVVRSTDVIHSFYAPNLLYKIQAVPGNVNEMHFTANEIGEFRGQCYQFCGLRHSDMHWVLDVRSQADYDAWLRSTQKAQGVGAPNQIALTTNTSPDATKSE